MKAFLSIKIGIFFIVAATALVACNNSQKSHNPQSDVVEIENMQFRPDTISVHKGDTVTWINNDIVAHNVTQREATWASPTLPSGATWQKVINKSDSYYCSIHINMKGEIVVE